MNELEIRELLALVMAYDSRIKPGKARAEAWADAAQRERWTWATASEAVKAHYARSRESIMPGDITKHVSAQRQLPPRIAETAGRIEDKPAADPVHIREVIADLSQRLGWKRQHDEDPAALDVECPYCHAPPGRPCGRMITRGPHKGRYDPLSAMHPSRVDLAKEAVGDGQ